MIYPFNRMAAYTAALIAAFVALAGCGDKSTGPGESITWVRAAPGSWYVFNLARYDTSGAIIPSTVRVDSMTVIDTNVTVAGVVGMMSLLVVEGGHRETLWVRYESNNDFRLFESGDTVGTLLPFASHKATETVGDTSNFSGGLEIRRDSIVYAGDERITVPAGTFTTFKARIVDDRREYTSTGVQSQHSRSIRTYYFAPSTGFLVKWTDEKEYLDAAGHLISRRLTMKVELTSYKLQ
jgi:hypothetical protein